MQKTSKAYFSPQAENQKIEVCCTDPMKKQMHYEIRCGGFYLLFVKKFQPTQF